MLSCGVVSAPLNQFICQKLEKNGIAALEKKFEQACSTVLALVTTHLNVAIDHIVFRVGELTGLSRWRERFGGVGLKEESLQPVCDAATALRLRTEEALYMLCKVRSNYKGFFKWLTHCCNNLSEGSESLDGAVNNRSELLLVADFLHHDLNEDRVHHVLHAAADGMDTLLKSLQQHFERLIAIPGQAVCSSFRLRAVMPLLEAPESELSCRARATVVDNDGCPYVYAVVSRVPVVAVGRQAPGKAWIVRFHTDGTAAPLEAAALQLDEGLSFGAADFYDDQQLSMLCATQEDSMQLCLAAYDELEFSAVHGNSGVSQITGEALELSCVNVLSSGSKPFTNIQCGSKPFASVFRPTSRIVVFDAEYEEEEDSDEDE